MEKFEEEESPLQERLEELEGAVWHQHYIYRTRAYMYLLGKVFVKGTVNII